MILVCPFDKYQKYLIPLFKKTENLFLIRGSENPCVEFLSIIHIFFYYIKYRPSIVHHFTLKPSLYGSIVARLLGIKKILNHITGLGPSLCSSREKIKFINKLIKPIYKYAFKNSINIFHNEDDRDIFIKRDFTTLNKSHVIKGSGVNVRYFANNKATKSIKKDIQILFPGRIIREKGIIELIKVCEKLWIEGYKFTLLIAGQIDKHNSSTLDKKTLGIFFIIPS